jgi:signal transduction histidine kinase
MDNRNGPNQINREEQPGFDPGDDPAVGTGYGLPDASPADTGPNMALLDKLSPELDLERALAREQQRAIELVYLYQISLDVMAQPSASIKEMAESILQNTLTLLNCNHACLLLWDEQAQALLPIYSCSQSLPSNSFWPEMDFAQEVFTQHRAIVQNVPDQGSNLAVTLFSKDKPVGIFTAHRPSFRDKFGDNEIQVGTLLASLMATMIANVKLQIYLNERLELLQTVMAAAPSGMAVIEDGRLLMANPAALQALRLYQTDFDAPVVVDGPDGLLLDRLREVRDRENASFEYRVVGYDSELRYLQIKPVSVGYNKELVQIDDVTLLREIDSRREQAVAHTSHELKTPLAVMNLGLSNLLAYYERMPDLDRRVMIEETLEQVSEMKALISGLLDPVRRRPDKPIFTEPALTTDPSKLIRAVVEDLRPLAQMSEITLRCSAEDVPAIRCAAPDLKTIVRNLVSNGIKYTPELGTVTVQVKTADHVERYVSLTVEDTGVGIPDNELERIFEPRYRATTHGTAEGTGIGLSIVKDLVKKAQGAISVESKIGQGSKFTVMIPSV